MESDVPLGAFLSGGIDSSIVVALMQAQSARPVKTFTIGFNEARIRRGERTQAPWRSTSVRSIPSSTSKPADALTLIPQIPDWYDEPFADSSQLPTYLVSRMTRRHVTVVALRRRRRRVVCRL